MLTLNPDFKELLNFFNLRNVRYLMIGGYAVNYHGHHRNTKDIDLWIDPTAENAGSVSLALQDFGFSGKGVTPERFEILDKVYAFGRPPTRIDILTGPSGVNFSECYERRTECSIDGLRIAVISREDLIANKRSSARARDLSDVEELGG